MTKHGKIILTLTLIIIIVPILGILLGFYYSSLSGHNPPPPIEEPKDISPTQTPPITINQPTPTEQSTLIHVDSPQPNEIVQSPLTITGEARGTWFFEASFPIIIKDSNDNTIGQGAATANGDWMTTEFVPFTAMVTFSTDPISSNTQGTIVLKKDNPSGLPQNDDSLEIPVIFSAATTQIDKPLTFLTSTKDTNTYCNGADMDTEGYRKTITEKSSVQTTETNLTTTEIIKETLSAATTGMCHDVITKLNITENAGTVTIPTTEGWAGISIVMCSCRPLVEVNLLQIPGITKVIWE